MTGSPGHDRNTMRIIMRINIVLVRIIHRHELNLRLLKNDDNDHGQQPQEHGIYATNQKIDSPSVRASLFFRVESVRIPTMTGVQLSMNDRQEKRQCMCVYTRIYDQQLLIFLIRVSFDWSTCLNDFKILSEYLQNTSCFSYQKHFLCVLIVCFFPLTNCQTLRFIESNVLV